jgi:hypothetical protein
MPPSHAARDTTDVQLDRTTRAFVARLEADEAPPLGHLTLDQARAGLPALQRLAALKPPGADLHDLTLPVGPAGHVQVRIVDRHDAAACFRASCMATAADGSSATATRTTA